MFSFRLALSCLTTFLGVAGLVGLPAGAADPEEEAVSAARAFHGTHGPAILREFADLLRIPNVQADQPGLQRTAAHIRDALGRRGVTAELLELDGVPPIVHGRLMVPGATRTLGIYVHYDGQPVAPEQWTYPPFEPTLLTAALEDGGRPRPLPADGEAVDPEWRLYARSSGDDKAPVPAILAALDALSAAGIAPTSNLIFFFEGQEEAGSGDLQRFLDRWRSKIDDVDLWLIADGPVHQSRAPQIVFGVRGYSGVDLRVYGATRYLHSGHYGNWAPNPALELSRLLAGMKDAAGRVTIEGFYDSVVPLTAEGRAAVERLPDDGDRLRQELGLAESEGGGASLIERILLPSFNVRGLGSASVGPTARNIIPTVADASIDMRLVKGNDPEKMLDLVEKHIAAQGYHIVREDPDAATRAAHGKIVRVTRRPGYPAVRTPMDLPIVRPVLDAARAAAGGPLILMPTLGGSLPLYLFADRLARPVVVVPIANHDDNQHAPDENLRIANLWYGIELFAAIFAGN